MANDSDALFTIDFVKVFRLRVVKERVDVFVKVSVIVLAFPVVKEIDADLVNGSIIVSRPLPMNVNDALPVTGWTRLLMLKVVRCRVDDIVFVMVRLVTRFVANEMDADERMLSMF